MFKYLGTTLTIRISFRFGIARLHNIDLIDSQVVDVWSSGLQRRVDLYTDTNISEKRTLFIFRVEDQHRRLHRRETRI
jgi:hypothetical protein